LRRRRAARAAGLTEVVAHRPRRRQEDDAEVVVGADEPGVVRYQFLRQRGQLPVVERQGDAGGAATGAKAAQVVGEPKGPMREGAAQVCDRRAHDEAGVVQRQHGLALRHEPPGDAGQRLIHDLAALTSTNVRVMLPSLAAQTKNPFSLEPSWFLLLSEQQRLVVRTAPPALRSVKPWWCPAKIARRFSVLKRASTASALVRRLGTLGPSGKCVRTTSGFLRSSFGSLSSSHLSAPGCTATLARVPCELSKATNCQPPCSKV